MFDGCVGVLFAIWIQVIGLESEDCINLSVYARVFVQYGKKNVDKV
jgi:hypothetical protein